MHFLLIYTALTFNFFFFKHVKHIKHENTLRVAVYFVLLIPSILQKQERKKKKKEVYLSLHYIFISKNRIIKYFCYKNFH